VRGWRRLAGRHSTRVGVALVAPLLLVAVAADLLASDLPLAVRVDGQSFLLPALTRPHALRGQDNASLQRRAREDPDGFVLLPPVPFGPHRTQVEAALSPPSAAHPLGTDELGRDVLARMIHGARASLQVGLGAVLLYVLIGVLLGAAAGFYGGRVDMVVSRVTEVLMSFPTFFLVLGVLGVVRTSSLWPVVVVIGLTRWTDVSRLVRGEVLRLRELDFVTASRALGASDLRLLRSHLLPNALGPVLVAATFGIPAAILLESGLSFLGFGVPPPAASWGELLTQAHRYVSYPGAWWLTVFPGLAIFFAVAGFNLLGEGLRDALDPR
jgi:peptide/nickel transport system permease protein